jgi:SAM-dependent methyltransferase
MQADEYRKLAETEERMWYFRALHRRLAFGLEHYVRSRAPRVLDAGCGTGGFLRRLGADHPAWRLTGIDVAPEACARARERTTAEIHQGSIAALPFPDAAFEAITTGDVLYHLDDPDAALREFARCLVPGGIAVVNEPAYRWLWSYHDEAVGSKHRFTRPELKARLRAAGLVVEYSSYANFFALPLIVARRKIFPPKQPTSDVQLFPWPIEQAFAAMAWLEHLAIRCGLPLPAGSSVFVVARKRV